MVGPASQLVVEPGEVHHQLLMLKLQAPQWSLAVFLDDVRRPPGRSGRRESAARTAGQVGFIERPPVLLKAPVGTLQGAASNSSVALWMTVPAGNDLATGTCAYGLRDKYFSSPGTAVKPRRRDFL